MTGLLLTWAGPLIGALAGIGLVARLRERTRTDRHDGDGPIMITESGRWIRQDGNPT